MSRGERRTLIKEFMCLDKRIRSGNITIEVPLPGADVLHLAIRKKDVSRCIGGYLNIPRQLLQGLLPFAAYHSVGRSIRSIYMKEVFYLKTRLKNQMLISRSLLLDNRVTKFLSSISMEIYLCHMLFFKALQKVKLTHLFGSDVASYIVTSFMVIALAVAFSFLAKKAFAFISQRLKKRS